MTFGEHGFRQMPPPPADATAGPPVLATGDSYTQGDEVDNDHTWPAQLQGLLRRRTINAGVAAYGFDQIVLRTEQARARGQAGADRPRHSSAMTCGVPR